MSGLVIRRQFEGYRLVLGDVEVTFDLFDMSLEVFGVIVSMN